MIEDVIAYLKTREAELRERGADRAAVGCQIAWLQLLGLREDARQDGGAPDPGLARSVIDALLRQVAKDDPDVLDDLREGLGRMPLGRA